jgi:hypothetical protein
MDIDKPEIYFFENIYYWLWLYNRKMDAMAPWNVAWCIVCVLKFLNLALIPFIILNIIGYESYLVMFIYPVILIIDYFKYPAQKYCIKKDKHGYIAWNQNKYCILSEKYNNMSYEQRRKHKRIFIIYVVSTIAVTVVTLLIFL